MDRASTWTQNTGDWLQTDWASLGSTDPLGGGSSSAWAAHASGPFTFDQRQSASRGIDYEPFYGGRSMYEPYSGFTNKIIDANIQQYLEREYPELFSFDTGFVNNGNASGGSVARDATFGRFAEDPRVYDEIEAAANKYGVPANLLLSVIARESSGHWGAGVTSDGKRYDNRTLTWLGSRSQWIAGYTGITEAAATSWGYNIHELDGNRALQVDAAANGLSRLFKQHGDWKAVVNTWYSGDPSGQTTPSDSGDYGTTNEYAADVMNWWKEMDDWTQANGGTVGGGFQAGVGSPNNAKWEPINRWDNYVAQASQKYGVPANLIKSIIYFETGGTGNPNAKFNPTDPSSATGLMQIMPNIWNNGNYTQLFDPAYNIDLGTKILRTYFDQYGSWDMATQAYLGFGTDANGTTNIAYRDGVHALWGELDAGVSGAFGEGGAPAISNINMIWGGIPTTITQEHGPSQFANDHPEWYEYSIPLLGALGHPGIDVGMPEGTKLFSPVTGTVRVAGPEQGYRIGPLMDVWTPGTGGLMIEMDNGHRVWLGHMAGIHVNVGDRVNAGTYVGLSGSAGTGAHLHLEYQIPSNRWGGPFEAVDPREALMGVYGGSFSGQMTGAGIDRPMTFQDLMRAGAMGEPIKGGMTIASGNSWNSWLQQAMAGKIPSSTSTGSWASRAADAEGMDTSGDSWRGYTPRTNMWSSWGYS